MKKSKKLTIAQKAKKAGIPAQTVYNRMHAGWHEKRALSVPVNKYTKKKPKKVEPKIETVGSRVKPATTPPKKAPSPLSRRMKKENPIPVQKFEAPKNKMFIYLAIVLLIVLIVVVST